MIQEAINFRDGYETDLVGSAISDANMTYDGIYTRKPFVSQMDQTQNLTHRARKAKKVKRAVSLGTDYSWSR